MLSERMRYRLYCVGGVVVVVATWLNPSPGVAAMASVVLFVLFCVAMSAGPGALREKVLTPKEVVEYEDRLGIIRNEDLTEDTDIDLALMRREIDILDQDMRQLVAKLTR